MQKEEVIEIAKKAAEEQGWPWEEPVMVSKGKKYTLFGRSTWSVWTNSEMRGCNVSIIIDDSNGEILSMNFTPR